MIKNEDKVIIKIERLSVLYSADSLIVFVDLTIRFSSDAFATRTPLSIQSSRMPKATKATTNVSATITAKDDANIISLAAKARVSVQPDNLPRRVKKDLGQMPLITANSIHDFVFWAVALVNPLPAMGVSLEIRGRMLEAYGLSDKLMILERGLKRSIQNMKGERPL